MEDNFSTDGVGDALELIQAYYICCALYFYHDLFKTVKTGQFLAGFHFLRSVRMRALDPSHVGLAIGYLTTWELDSTEQTCKKTEEKCKQLSYNFISEVPCHRISHLSYSVI